MDEKLLQPVISMDDKNIENCIYTIRGQQVMIDTDVAFFFNTSVSLLNRQMKRNIERFPDNFCFQLEADEYKNLKCQFGTSNKTHGGKHKLPYAYTEYGIIALSGVLRNEIAAKMSVEIVQKFIQMRKFILENSNVLLTLAKLQNRQINFEIETNKQFSEVFRRIEKLDLPKEATFFEGQYYDAYEFITSILLKAKERIIIIDPYCDSKVFTYLKHISQNVNITICKGPHSKLSGEDIKMFESQYGPVDVITINNDHDRFIISDDDCYSLGASLNYAGKKFFAINKIDSPTIVESVIGLLDDSKIIKGREKRSFLIQQFCGAKLSPQK